MTLTFRLTPARRVVLHREFTNAARETLSHMAPETQMRCDALFGPIAEAEYPGKIDDLPSRLRSHAEALQKLNRRSQISVTAPMAVDGEFPKQFGAVYRAYIAAKGEPATKGGGIVVVKKGIITLSWGSGSYRIFSGVLLAGDKFTGFEGQVEISADLLASGGAFQLEEAGEAVRLVSLQGRLSTWRIALAFVRDSRMRRGSYRFRSLLQRFRSGAKIGYSAVQTRYSSGRHTEITLSGGKADAAFERLLNSRQKLVLALAERAERYLAGLTTWAKEEAAKFAARPDLQAANAARELVEAQQSFTDASERLFNLAPKACYKGEIPTAPFTEHPGKLPAMKSVGDGIARQYRGVCSSFDSAWERLLAARANAPATPAGASAVEHLMPAAATAIEHSPMSLAAAAA